MNHEEWESSTDETSNDDDDMPSLEPSFAPPQSPAECITLATSYHRAGKLTESLQICMQALALGPSDIEQHIELLVMAARGNFYCGFTPARVEDAKTHLRLALRMDPDNAPAHALFRRISSIDEANTSGVSLRKGGWLGNAKERYDEALGLIEPDNHEVLCVVMCNRAEVFNELRDYNSCVADCTACIRMKPTFAKPYLFRKRAFHGLDKLDDALRDMQNAARLDRSYEKELVTFAKVAKDARCYYKILGVAKNCDDDSITKAYKQGALVWHPDRWSGGSPDDQKYAEGRFKDLGEACRVLLDPHKRRQYDSGNKNVDSTDEPNEPHGYGGGGGFRGFRSGFFNMEDLFAEFFAENFGRRQQRQYYSQYDSYRTSDPPQNSCYNEDNYYGAVPVDCSVCSKPIRPHLMRSHMDSHPACPVCNEHFLKKTQRDQHKQEKHVICEHCDEWKMNESELRAHKKAKHVRLECGVCKAVLWSQAAMWDHNKEAHPTCSICKRKFDTAEKYASHQRDQHHICTVCVVAFPNDTALRKHRKVHPTCGICGAGFQMQHLLDSHRGNCKPIGRSNTPPPVADKAVMGATCETCGETFETPKALKKHVKDQHPRCHACSLVFTNATEHADHMATHHPLCPVCHATSCEANHPSCSWCEKLFTSQEACEQHVAHAHPMCEHCPFAFASVEALEAHQREDHHPCDLCVRVFGLLESLAEHKVSEHPRCDVCGIQVANASALKKHKKKEHETKAAAAVAPPKVSGVPCTFCERTFGDAKQLDQHCKKQHPTCGVCSNVFRGVEDLEDHQKEAHPICGVCSDMFLNREALETHKKAAHVGCSFCSIRSFVSAEALQQHMAQSHPTCDRCSKRFVNKALFEVHERSEHSSFRTVAKEVMQPPQQAPPKQQIELHTCAVCGFEFTSREFLAQHERDAHPKCDVCDHVCTSVKALHQHTLDAHHVVAPLPKTPPQAAAKPPVNVNVTVDGYRTPLNDLVDNVAKEYLRTHPDSSARECVKGAMCTDKYACTFVHFLQESVVFQQPPPAVVDIQSSKASPQKTTRPLAAEDDAFSGLMTVLKSMMVSTNRHRLLRSHVGAELKKRGVYANFKELTSAAESVGLIVMGGSAGSEWIELTEQKHTDPVTVSIDGTHTAFSGLMENAAKEYLRTHPDNRARECKRGDKCIDQHACTFVHFLKREAPVNVTVDGYRTPFRTLMENPAKEYFLLHPESNGRECRNGTRCTDVYRCRYVHYVQEEVECPVCSQLYEDTNALSHHIDIVHKTCEVCEEFFPNVGARDRHVRAVHECRFCEELFDATALKRHARTCRAV